MAKCVYCLKGEMDTTFTKREHVILDSLGSFQPLNPTLLPEYGVVCDACNSSFSQLEAAFIEDTWEGVHGQRLGLKNRKSITIRGKNFKIDRIAGFGDDFFDRMFFFLELKDGKVVPVLKDQIKLKRFDNGYRVFLPEALQSVRDGSAEYRKLVGHFKRLDKKDICLFAETQEKLDSMIALLKRFGIDYKQKESKSQFFPPGTKLILEENFQCTLDKDGGRVLAKIAFNYFAYCAVQSNATRMLYTNEFDAIREFIALGKGDLRKIIPSISEKPFLMEEEKSGGRFIGYVIAMSQEDGNIVVRMSLLGLPPIYKIILGAASKEHTSDSFGCGHAFIPFNGTIVNLSQKMPINPTEDQLRLSFGLRQRTHC
ncbi:hypothetical protein KBD34_05335 [Patescibacteria group bacterium]|nr:hypothetical protein [Patescibacteria group bacterium]